MKVDRATAALLRVEVDLPKLPERVRLDEVSLVVHVETVVDRMILQFGHVAGYVDHRHVAGECMRRSRATVPVVDGNEILGVLGDAVDSVAAALARLDDWGLAGTRPGQYRSDLAADVVVVEVLTGAGYSVLSEESGLTEAKAGALLAVVDPVDGSTNASRGIPWFATSICVLDDEGPLAAMVANQAVGTLYAAVRGEGATRNGLPIAPSACNELGRAVVGLSGYPKSHLGWKQYRALGAVALDMCAVADGTLDGYVDCSRDAHGSWDYLGALLVCREAGVSVGERFGRDLVVRTHAERRDPVAAGTPALLASLLEAVGRD
jgi:myo-inositol-1(or 4)-monophosphatase